MQRRLLPFLLLGLWGPLAGPPGRAATLAACPTAVQAKADQALSKLQQRQHKEDEALRQAPTSSYATMNGPVIRELEKRKQQGQLAGKLKGDAARQHHCQLQGSAFGD